MTHEQPRQSQAEISRQYEESAEYGQKVVLSIGQMTLDKLMGLAIIDDSKNLAVQFHRAHAEYIERRETDPTFDDQLAAARQRHEPRPDESKFAPPGPSVTAFRAATEQLEQQPETD